MARPKKYTEEKINELAEEFLLWAKAKFDAKQVFWFKDWAIESGFTWQRVSEFAEQNSKFSDALSKIKLMQESVIVKAGFSKSSNPTFAIFALKNVAGWRDTQDIKHSGGVFNGRIKWDTVDLEQLARLRSGEDALNVLRPDQID